LLHYLVKCRSRSLTVHNIEFVYWVAYMHRLKPGIKINWTYTIGAYPYYQWQKCRPTDSSFWNIATSFWYRCCFLTFMQRLAASFSFFSRTVPHHIAPKTR